MRCWKISAPATMRRTASGPATASPPCTPPAGSFRRRCGKKTARWAIELEEGGERFANIQVIKLGRHGYHQITWAGPVHGADGTPMFLQAMVDSHGYDDGHRYADYSDGDQLAGFGIGALVTATAVGSKPGKGVIAAIVGAGLLILKKAWFVVIAALGGVGAFVSAYSTAAIATPLDALIPEPRTVALRSASISARLGRT
jgi:hypothetical protein